MRNDHTYLLPDAEMMRLFYEGKLNPSETKAIRELLVNDELMREAFANLTTGDFNMVEKISVSVNSRIAGLVDKPPFFHRWQIWLSIFIGVMILTGTVIVFDSWKSEKSTDAGSMAENKRHDSEKEKMMKRKMSHTAILSEQKLKNETTMSFNSTQEEKEVGSITVHSKDTNGKKVNPLIENKTNDGPADHKNNEIKDNKITNPNTIDAGNTTKKYKIRLSDASVLQAENLAEKEANSGDDRENMDVRDVNIGNPVSDKKKSNFNLEDMPQYRGGNEALASYVKGKIAIKSYTQEKKILSTVVEFEVNPKGKIENIKLQNALDPVMEKDIKDALASASFTPGKKSGKKGSMFYMMALVFE